MNTSDSSLDRSGARSKPAPGNRVRAPLHLAMRNFPSERLEPRMLLSAAIIHTSATWPASIGGSDQAVAVGDSAAFVTTAGQLDIYDPQNGQLKVVTLPGITGASYLVASGNDLFIAQAATDHLEQYDVATGAISAIQPQQGFFTSYTGIDVAVGSDGQFSAGNFYLLGSGASSSGLIFATSRYVTFLPSMTTL